MQSYKKGEPRTDDSFYFLILRMWIDIVQPSLKPTNFAYVMIQSFVASGRTLAIVKKFRRTLFTLHHEQVILDRPSTHHNRIDYHIHHASIRSVELNSPTIHLK